MIDLPQDFLTDIREILKEEFDEFYSSYSLPAQKGFRINPYKRSDFDLTEFADGKIPYVQNGYYTLKTDLGSTPFHHGGGIYMQEPSAMFPSSVLAPDKGAKVLDMCAAPGGKSGQLAEMIGKDGVLVSNEIFTDRCKILLGNVERMGYPNVVVTCLAPKDIAKNLAGWFDYVLVDAPCSGEGMFRKNPEAISEWSKANVLTSAERQIEILKEAAKCVKQGGKIVYSTCTFSIEENERTVEEFLRSGDFELIEIPKENGVVAGLDTNGYTARLYPHRLRGEGHFTALFKRITPSEETKPVKVLKPLNAEQKKAVREFADGTLKILPDVYEYNGTLVIPPKILPPITKAMRYGVKVGDVEKRLIPHHQFFSAYSDLFERKINLNLDDDRVNAYLHGEEIETDLKNGWCVVAIEGLAIGGGKVTDGRAKNHYPKGLRTKKS